MEEKMSMTKLGGDIEKDLCIRLLSERTYYSQPCKLCTYPRCEFNLQTLPLETIKRVWLARLRFCHLIGNRMFVLSYWTTNNYSSNTPRLNNSTYPPLVHLPPALAVPAAAAWVEAPWSTSLPWIYLSSSRYHRLLELCSSSPSPPPKDLPQNHSARKCKFCRSCISIF